MPRGLPGDRTRCPRRARRAVPAFAVILILCLQLFLPTPTRAQEADNPPVRFSADQMTFDRELGIVTAKGNVEVNYQTHTLLADTVSYNQKEDIVSASGDVTLLEPTGDVVFSDHMELTGDLKNGVIENIRVLMRDRSRMAASGARRINDDIEMRNAVYSPCELCPDAPERDPLWQIKAVRVFHDKSRRTVEYTDAWLEIRGVPVAYVPYLSHPDPTVRRESGFLAPRFGNSSQLGTTIKLPYFVNISPHADATVTPIYYAKEGPGMEGEYRHRLHDGTVDLAASLTQDSEDDVRGHIRGSSQFDIDDTWRWGLDLDRATDDTYLRRYGYPSERSLTTSLFAEGFRKSNYVRADVLTFQGLEIDDDPGETPLVAPLVQYSHLGESSAFGGRTRLDASMLSLTRTDGTDTRRLSVRPGWEASYISPLGDIYEASTWIDADMYHVNAAPQNDSDDTYNGVTGRIVPQAKLGWRMPFIKRQGNIHQTIEPLAAVMVAPNGGNPDEIPNEDSQEFEFDETSLFRENRFAGNDRIETGTRLHYGLRWGVFGAGGGYSKVFVGQSFRPHSDGTFPEGSGLSDDLSDVVARVEVAPREYLNLVYRTRIGYENLDVRRNELDFSGGIPMFRLHASYSYFEAQQGSEFAGREELLLGFTSQINRYWRTEFSSRQDIAEDEMRRIGLGLVYEDECLVFSTQLQRNFFADRDLRPEDSIFFQVTFKTLGDFQSGTTTLN